jgi:hypothetical protein
MPDAPSHPIAGGEQAANLLQPADSSRHATTAHAKVGGTIAASPLVMGRLCLFSPSRGHPVPVLEQGRLAQACIGLAVPGRPIGPWSRRTGAPKASATRRDRSPPVHGGYTRSWQVGECNGHERSPRELRNRRPDRQRSCHQDTLQVAGQSSSLLPPPTAPLLVAVSEGGRLVDSSDLLDGAAHGALLDDDGAPTRRSQAALRQADRRRRGPGRPARPTPTRTCGGSSSPDALDTVHLVRVDY